MFGFHRDPLCTVRPKIKYFRSFEIICRTRKKTILGSTTVFFVRKVFSPFVFGRTRKKTFRSKKTFSVRKKHFPFENGHFGPNWSHFGSFWVILARFGAQECFLRSKSFSGSKCLFVRFGPDSQKTFPFEKTLSFVS